MCTFLRGGGARPGVEPPQQLAVSVAVTAVAVVVVVVVVYYTSIIL